MGKQRIAFAAIAGIVLLTGCSRIGKQYDPSESAPAKGGKGADAKAGGPAESFDFRDQGAAPSRESGLAAVSSGNAAQVPPVQELPGQKVVKTADVRIRIGKDLFQERYSRASQIAERLGGFVTGSSTGETKGRVASGTITMRVPSDKFQAALAELRGLGKVASENQSGSDVTAEFVDLESRLRHLGSQEAFFLRLMDEARTIADMISIQQQLSAVQLQIEEVKGRLQFLKDQTTFSTISAHIFETGITTTPAKGLGRAWQEALRGFRTIVAGIIVAAGWLAPFILIGLAGLVAWRMRRRPEAAKP